MKLAIFDFDGTIYKYETFTLFMNHLKERFPSKYRRFFAAILPIYLGYKCKVIPEPKMKHKLMQRYILALQDLTNDELQQFFTEVADKMEGDFHTEVIDRLKTHQKNGFYTMIVSGAFTPLLEAVNKEYQVDELIGTGIPKNNKEFTHVHAERKTNLIHAQMKGKTVNWEESYAYGDSVTDLAVLDLVGNPIAVAPDDRLNQIAKERNWEIIP